MTLAEIVEPVGCTKSKFYECEDHNCIQTDCWGEDKHVRRVYIVIIEQAVALMNQGDGKRYHNRCESSY